MKHILLLTLVAWNAAASYAPTPLQLELIQPSVRLEQCKTNFIETAEVPADTAETMCDIEASERFQGCVVDAIDEHDLDAKPESAAVLCTLKLKLYKKAALFAQRFPDYDLN